MNPKANPDTLKTAPKGPQDGPRWAPKRSFRGSRGSKVMRPFSYTNGRITFGPIRHPSPEQINEKQRKTCRISWFSWFFLVACKGLQDGPKRAPRAAHEVPKRAPRGPKRLPKCPQEGPTMAPRGLQDAPRAKDHKGLAADSCRRRIRALLL